ncbi:hypothetical protein OIU79_011134 [Salix purpurea]|uniref:Uncharacterized protein n=1 Tax=Salix purpurea TaxID=77065 RepID=A0A9Q0TAM2_SALPP|nr:hypothetical protein OIU79_011134 [Salix purpurea]
MEKVHIFTKKLKPTAISHALSFPTHALEAFSFPEGAHKMRFEAVDATDTVGEQKGLVPEDRVAFFMETLGEADGMIRIRYTVRAQRKVMVLMGQDVWVDVEHLPLYGL